MCTVVGQGAELPGRVAVRVVDAIIWAEHVLKDVLVIRSGYVMRRNIAVQRKLVLCTGFSEGRVLEPASSSAAALIGASILAAAS